MNRLMPINYAKNEQIIQLLVNFMGILTNLKINNYIRKMGKTLRRLKLFTRKVALHKTSLVKMITSRYIKIMFMNFPKTLKKDIKLSPNFSVFGKYLINLDKYVIKIMQKFITKIAILLVILAFSSNSKQSMLLKITRVKNSRNLYAKLTFRVFLSVLLAFDSNLKQNVLIEIMTIKFPCIRNSTTLFPNIWAFNSNFKQYMLLKKMSEFFTKTTKNRGLCLLY